MQAKFKVTTSFETMNNGEEVHMTALTANKADTNGDADDNTFANGNLVIWVNDPDLRGTFKRGDIYTMDLTKSE